MLSNPFLSSHPYPYDYRMANVLFSKHDPVKESVSKRLKDTLMKLLELNSKYTKHLL